MTGAREVKQEIQLTTHLRAQILDSGNVIIENDQYRRAFSGLSDITRILPYNNNLFVMTDEEGTIYRVNIKNETPLDFQIQEINLSKRFKGTDTILKIRHSTHSPYIVIAYREKTEYIDDDSENLLIYNISSNKFYRWHFEINEQRIINLALISPGYIAILWKELTRKVERGAVTIDSYPELKIYKFEQRKLSETHKIRCVTNFMFSPCNNFAATVIAHDKHEFCQIWDIRNGKWNSLLKTPTVSAIVNPCFSADGRFYYGHHTQKVCEEKGTKEQKITTKLETMEIDLRSLSSLPVSLVNCTELITYNQNLNQLHSQHLLDKLLFRWLDKLLIKIFDGPLPKLSRDVIGIITNYIPLLIFEIFSAFPLSAREILWNQLVILHNQGPKATHQIKAIIEFVLLYTVEQSVPKCVESLRNTYMEIGFFSKKKELSSYLLNIFSQVETIIKKQNRDTPHALTKHNR